MGARSAAFLLAALLNLSACGGGATGPSGAPSAGASAPAASVGPSAAPSAAGPHTAEDLIDSATFTTRDAPKLPFAPVDALFQRGCATVWGDLAPDEIAADREVACLAAIGWLYARYAASDGRATPTWDAAVATYDYVLLQMPTAKAYLDAGLRSIDAARAGAAPSPTGLKGIEALAKTAPGPVDASKLHRAVHDLFGRDLGVLLAACKGFDYPGTGLPACFPYPLYPPTADTNDTPLAADRTVGAIAACEYAPASPKRWPNATEYDCGQAAVPFWLAYLATGDEAYWDLMAGVRDLYASRGGGGTDPGAVIASNAGCYASWVLAPGTQPSCQD